jgi:hypothetical protein
MTPSRAPPLCVGRFASEVVYRSGDAWNTGRAVDLEDDVRCAVDATNDLARSLRANGNPSRRGVQPSFRVSHRVVNQHRHLRRSSLHRGDHVRRLAAVPIQQTYHAGLRYTRAPGRMRMNSVMSKGEDHLMGREGRLRRAAAASGTNERNQQEDI